MKKFSFLAVLSFLAVADVAKTAPLPLGKEEGDNPASGFFAGYSYRAAMSVNQERMRRGLPQITEHPALAQAGYLLLSRMILEDWVGTKLPSGYSLQSALRAAGYPVDAEVQVVFRVRQGGYEGEFGEPNNAFPKNDFIGPSAANACSTKNGFNPNLSAFGYYTITPESDFGRVTTVTNDPLTTGRYEIMLFGSVLPASPERPRVDVFAMGKRFARNSKIPVVATVSARRGQPVSRAVIPAPKSKYVTGTVKLAGRLPAGIKFNPSTATFVGKAKKAGTYRVKVTANYRKRKGYTSPGTDGGTKTVTIVFRILR